MAAPILWAPGMFGSFCWKPHAHKTPRFRGGVFWKGGWKCQFYFYGCGALSETRIFDVVRIAFRPLLSFCLSPCSCRLMHRRMAIAVAIAEMRCTMVRCGSRNQAPTPEPQWPQLYAFAAAMTMGHPRAQSSLSVATPVMNCKSYRISSAAGRVLRCLQ